MFLGNVNNQCHIILYFLFKEAHSHMLQLFLHFKSMSFYHRSCSLCGHCSGPGNWL